MERDAADLTMLLNRGAQGDTDAADQAFDRVYARLKLIAAGPSGPARRDGTLHATALVHEAYARLFRGAGTPWESRAHFFGVAAKAMRRIAIDHARASLAKKRGGEWSRVGADRLAAEASTDPVDVIALDDGRRELAALSPRQAQIVELRFFAGLSVREVAQIVGRSDRTVELDWRAARAWLKSRLDGEVA